MSRSADYLRSITSGTKDLSFYRLRGIAEYIEGLEAELRCICNSPAIDNEVVARIIATLKEPDL